MFEVSETRQTRVAVVCLVRCLTACLAARSGSAQMMNLWARALVNIAREKPNREQLKILGERQINIGMSSQALVLVLAAAGVSASGRHWAWSLFCSSWTGNEPALQPSAPSSRHPCLTGTSLRRKADHEKRLWAHHVIVSLRKRRLQNDLTCRAPPVIIPVGDMHLGCTAPVRSNHFQAPRLTAVIAQRSLHLCHCAVTNR